MNPKRRIALIDRLADAVGYVGPDFERFGGIFLDCLLELPINHQGVNLVGYPVSGVIDSVGDDEMLPAREGDCMLISYPDRDRSVWVLVDGGRRGTAAAVLERLRGERVASIDLLIVTHVDRDHIEEAWRRDLV